MAFRDSPALSSSGLISLSQLIIKAVVMMPQSLTTVWRKWDQRSAREILEKLVLPLPHLKEARRRKLEANHQEQQTKMSLY
jgi:hypothetical protein